MKYGQRREQERGREGESKGQMCDVCKRVEIAMNL